MRRPDDPPSDDDRKLPTEEEEEDHRPDDQAGSEASPVDEDPEPPADDSLPEYDGPSATEAERDQFYRDQALRAALERFFTRRVPAGEVDDLVQETRISAYRAPRLPSGGGADRDKYVFGIANKMLAERARRGERQVPIARGASFDRAVQAVDAVADRDLFAKVTSAAIYRIALGCVDAEPIGPA